MFDGLWWVRGGGGGWGRQGPYRDLYMGELYIINLSLESAFVWNIQLASA